MNFVYKKDIITVSNSHMPEKTDPTVFDESEVEMDLFPVVKKRNIFDKKRNVGDTYQSSTISLRQLKK
jgi:hypothetical protein